jgi:hypothetical protein
MSMKKNITNLIVCLLAMFILTGCDISFHGRHHTPTGPTVVTTEYQRPDTSYTEVSYSDSYYYDDDYSYCEEPYWHAPEWCDYYDDGSVYCVWYVDGWYEEWYQWDYYSCWEYNGSWY